MTTQKNVGTIDKIIRIILSIGLFVFAWNYTGSFVVSAAAIVVGAILLLTSITGFCLIWKLLGIDTTRKQ